MKENVIKNKSFEFALRVIKLYQFLTETRKEFILSKQLLRSGTSIGAMVRESEHAENKADFVHKLSIALKEANETEYWVELLYKSDYIDEVLFNSISTDINEILRLLISIIKSSKQKKLSIDN
ncbi:MAG: four helix bundle protein [Salinivirgaceae bacterium]|nr:four helix bundle protein [Salinivirgaceae bacterium]